MSSRWVIVNQRLEESLDENCYLSILQDRWVSADYCTLFHKLHHAERSLQKSTEIKKEECYLKEVGLKF